MQMRGQDRPISKQYPEEVQEQVNKETMKAMHGK